MKSLFADVETNPTTKHTAYKSFSASQSEIIRSIVSLHCPEGIQADITFGNGGFYTSADTPEFKFDIDPQVQGVVRANSERLPIPDNSLRSVMFDPPFITYVKNRRDHNCLMAKRFGGYYTYGELEDHYIHTISEVWRVLRPSGVFVFKCQDIIHNHRLFPTHVLVCNRAELEGFRVQDLFVLVADNRMPGPQKGVQRHARIHQSYFWVFKKPPERRKALTT